MLEVDTDAFIRRTPNFQRLAGWNSASRKPNGVDFESWRCFCMLGLTEEVLGLPKMSTGEELLAARTKRQVGPSRDSGLE